MYARFRYNEVLVYCFRISLYFSQSLSRRFSLPAIFFHSSLLSTAICLRIQSRNSPRLDHPLHHRQQDALSSGTGKTQKLRDPRLSLLCPPRPWNRSSPASRPRKPSRTTTTIRKNPTMTPRTAGRDPEPGSGRTPRRPVVSTWRRPCGETPAIRSP